MMGRLPLRGLLGLGAQVQRWGCGGGGSCCDGAGELNYPGNVTLPPPPLPCPSASHSFAPLHSHLLSFLALFLLIPLPQPLSPHHLSFLSLSCPPLPLACNECQQNMLMGFHSLRGRSGYIFPSTQEARMHRCVSLWSGDLRVVRTLSEMAPTWGC